MGVLESGAAELTWVRQLAVTVIVWIGVVVAGSTVPATRPTTRAGWRCPCFVGSCRSRLSWMATSI